MKRTFSLLAFLAIGLAGCSALPDKPVQAALYDLGVPLASGAPAPDRVPLLLPELEARGILESTDLLYRLAYDDPHRVRPYAFARWSAPPAQLVRQRLRDVLGRDRVVLDSTAAAAMARRGGAAPPVLRVEIEEFDQVFDSTTASRGVLRLRCTLLENTGGGERLVAQRSFVLERPAPSADAAGGVRALSAATEAAALDIASWLQQR
jgi:cholesterol transport system auxiliary component